MRRHRKVKIVATLGPSSSDFATIRALFEAGADVFRLNMSHGDHSVHSASYENIRRASEELDTTVAILADLQGPKIRLGNFADGPHALDVGDTFTITIEDVPGSKELCSTTHKGLPGDVRPGDPIVIDDGLDALTDTARSLAQGTER